MEPAEDTKHRILTAAGPVFAEHGFQAATVREICQKAGVNVAAINYHFGDKERLYIEVVKMWHRGRWDAIPLPEWPVGTPPEVKLRDLIHTTLTRMMCDSESWNEQLMFREMASPTGATVELVRDFIRPHFETLSNIIEEITAGRLSASRRHMVVFSVIGQCLHYKVAGAVVALLLDAEARAQQTLDAVTDHITRFTLAALQSDAFVDASDTDADADG